MSGRVGRSGLQRDVRGSWSNGSGHYLDCGDEITGGHILKRVLFMPFVYVCVATGHVESQFPDQGSNPHPLHWKRVVLAIGSPGKSGTCTF